MNPCMCYYSLRPEHTCLAEPKNVRSIDPVLEKSLGSLRLDPEPFLHLQAIQDRRLWEYMVTFDLSSSVLDDRNFVFWAPLGGGKSALRMYLMQNCWAMLWIKAFLASDVRASGDRPSSIWPDRLSIAGQYPIHWTQERLVEMLQLRIQVASYNRLSPFDAFTGLDCVEKLETLLVARVSPRSQEVLWLTQQTLRQYWLRIGGAGGNIERADLDKALEAVEFECRKSQSSQNGLD